MDEDSTSQFPCTTARSRVSSTAIGDSGEFPSFTIAGTRPEGSGFDTFTIAGTTGSTFNPKTTKLRLPRDSVPNLHNHRQNRNRFHSICYTPDSAHSPREVKKPANLHIDFRAGDATFGPFPTPPKSAGPHGPSMPNHFASAPTTPLDKRQFCFDDPHPRRVFFPLPGTPTSPLPFGPHVPPPPFNSPIASPPRFAEPLGLPIRSRNNGSGNGNRP